jgi:hypothetical protein
MNAFQKQNTIEAMQFQECIRHLLCMSRVDFFDVFGEDVAEHLWQKWIVEHRKDAGKFLCYLDDGNMRKLHNHFREYIKSLGVDVYLDRIRGQIK